MPVSIQEVKAKHESDLMGVPGVVSVGIGRGEQGESIIVVGVENDEAAKNAKVPQRLEGYAVRVQVIGAVRAQ